MTNPPPPPEDLPPVPPMSSAEAFEGDLARIVADETRKQIAPLLTRIERVESSVKKHDDGLKRAEITLGRALKQLENMSASLKQITQLVERTAMIEGTLGVWGDIMRQMKEAQDEHSEEMKALRNKHSELEGFDRDHDERYRLMHRAVFGYGGDKADDTRVLGSVGKTEQALSMAGDALKKVTDFIRLEEERRERALKQREAIVHLLSEAVKNPKDNLLGRVLLAAMGGGGLLAIAELVKAITGG